VDAIESDRILVLICHHGRKSHREPSLTNSSRPNRDADVESVLDLLDGSSCYHEESYGYIT
jgi:hypothetical protein